MTPRSLLLTAAAALVLAAPAAAARTHASAGLVGEVGPGYTIEVNLKGKDVKTLKAGTYRILIEDKAAIHNFHLFGPGLNKKTTVAFQGKQTWTITLRKGTYHYQCDPHASFGMKGSFRVTS
ncbi:MAG TPA: plastocyanin/azurin family copper-binding protein [Gaiellaceae bacterium]|nr:plastocyanin/azurin family copper-binding protein [Gaiellaceae bacterium]